MSESAMGRPRRSNSIVVVGDSKCTPGSRIPQPRGHRKIPVYARPWGQMLIPKKETRLTNSADSAFRISDDVIAWNWPLVSRLDGHQPAGRQLPSCLGGKR